MKSANDAADSGLTAFRGAEASLRARCGNASIEAAEFQRKLSRCSLAACRGTCCYDGIAVDDDTAAVLERLATERAADFADIGLQLPDKIIVNNEWRGVLSRKTAVKPFPFRSLVADYPNHFNETACVFLLEDGRCGLQVIAEKDGRHPWFYKPFACWLHPIKMTEAAIHLYDEANDPNRLPGYDGFVCHTHCGRTSACGAPATEVLKDELDFLGRLLDRDLGSEVRTQTAAATEPESGSS